MMNLVGNPNPPGVQVGAGQIPPPYQAIPGAQWDGAARGLANAPAVLPITKTIGMPSNDVIKSALTILPWEAGKHKLIREGHLAFVARDIPPNTRETQNSLGRNAKVVTLQHLQEICRIGHAKARDALRNNRLPSGINISIDQFDNLGEHNIEEHFGSPERELLIPPENTLLKAAVKLLKIGFFKYLLPCGVRMHWTFYGVVTNTNRSEAPEQLINRDDGNATVVNHIVAKKGFTFNIWGGPERVCEGAKLGLVLRRANIGGQASHPEFLPWSDCVEETAPFSVRGYYDERSRFQHGHYIPLGVCEEITGEWPAELVRQRAIGNREMDHLAVHEAVGSLPRIGILVNCA